MWRERGVTHLRIALYPDETQPPGPLEEFHDPNCGEGYHVTLVVEVESNVYGTY